MFERLGQLLGKKIDFVYNDTNRIGDHICYISNMTRFKKHYPDWCITRSLDDITVEIIKGVENEKK